MKPTLMTIANGAAVELFADGLDRIFQDIVDPNKKSAGREIVLKFSFPANDERTLCTAKISCTVKLSPPKEVSTFISIGESRDGEVVAEEVSTHQQTRFDSMDNVVSLKGGK